MLTQYKLAQVLKFNSALCRNTQGALNNWLCGSQRNVFVDFISYGHRIFHTGKAPW